VLGAGAVLVVLLIIAGIVVALPYYALGPGGARATEPTVTVRGAPSYDAGEDLLFTTVVVDRVNAFELIDGWLDPDVDVVPVHQLDGDQTPAESQQLNQQLMDDSKVTATQVALEHLGFDVVSGTGATVQEVVPDAPADGVIEPGDTVVRANGHRVTRVEELVAEIDGAQPGDRLDLVLQSSDGQRREVTVELAEFPDAPDEAFLGVGGLTTRDLEVHYPFDVRIDSGDVRGPSAGLAFTLAVLDVLTPGDISGGTPVAVTGTIDGLGRVGRVGGVEFKALAAQQAGAEVFIVPAGEEAQAAEKVEGLRIEPVETLQDALEVLDSLGGNALHLEPPVPSAG
jgi:Lon-like protease